MADFIKLSDNCYLSAKGKLISEVHLPYGNHSVHVPPYLPITQKSVITAMNLKQEDSKRHYHQVTEFTLGMCHFKFFDRYTIGVSFINEWEKSMQVFYSKLNNYGVSEDLRFNANTVFSLGDKTAQSVMNCPAEDLVPITELGTLPVRYLSVRGKSRTCYLSYGMNFKQFPLKYQGRDLGLKSRLFFLGTCGILFDDKLRLSAIVTFERYNNLYVDIKDVLYIASPVYYKAIWALIQML